MLEFSVQHAEVALSTAAEDVGDGIQGHDNDTGISYTSFQSFRSGIREGLYTYF